MLVVSMILGMLGGLLGLMIEFGMLNRVGVKAPVPPVTEVDFILLFLCALACILGGAMVPSRRAMGDMYWTEIGGLLMLTGGTAMGIHLGMASPSSVPVGLAFVGAILALVIVDSYPRRAPVEES
jgi:hypothetical protein